MDDIKIRGYIVKRSKDEQSILNGGLLKVDPASDEYAQLAANKLKGYDGRELQIHITDEQSWTNRANRLFHGLLRKIVHSGQTDFWELMGRAPDSFEEVRDWALVEMGGAEVHIVGKYMHIESWTNFSKKRACKTIDNLLNWMGMKGIEIDAEKLEGDSLKEIK